MAENREHDRRVLRSKEAVLRSALEVLREGGLAGLSIDEVAARSGVAKTTVYRHWPSRASLVIDACSQLGKMDFVVADTGALRSDLIALAREIGALFQSPESSILPSILDAAERDPEMADVFAVSNEKMTVAFRKVLLRAVKRREFGARKRRR